MNNMFYVEGSKLIANRKFIAFIVYISLLLDNILLTVIVPILPDYLSEFDNNNRTVYNIPNSVLYKKFDLHYVPHMLSNRQQLSVNNLFNATQATQPSAEVAISNRTRLLPHKKSVEDENESIAILLATKALTQLIFNPIVGSLTLKFGYKVLIFFGTFNLLIASLVFALGDSYIILLFARAVQGVGSACITVCGMSLVAQLYPEEDKRSKIMGVILGSIALGVLIGYPFGGILYDFIGKSAPFIIIAIFAFISLVLQIGFVNFDDRLEMMEGINGGAVEESSSKWWPLLTDRLVLVITSAILISTSSMAILEPCLPIWLITNLHPKRWQLGTVFIPDSIGYLIGTNYFGSFAYRVGQIKVSVCALLVVGISCILLPFATTVLKLLVPHFCLGLGIGVLDAALVPLLATVVDSKYAVDDESPTTTTQHTSHYGAVYAIQQMAVSLAYSIVPLLGSEMAHTLGFPWLMRLVGMANILYGPFLWTVVTKNDIRGIVFKENGLALRESEGDSTTSTNKYKKFYNAID